MQVRDLLFSLEDFEYDTRRPYGGGQFGKVYEAEFKKTHEHVALKIILPDAVELATEQPTNAAHRKEDKRFVRELQAAAYVVHTLAKPC